MADYRLFRDLIILKGYITLDVTKISKKESLDYKNYTLNKYFKIIWI
jgi:hypothetical protein